MASAPVQPVITTDTLLLIVSPTKDAFRVTHVEAGVTSLGVAEALQAPVKTVEQPVIISNMLLVVEVVRVVPALAVSTVRLVCKG